MAKVRTYLNNRRKERGRGVELGDLRLHLNLYPLRSLPIPGEAVQLGLLVEWSLALFFCSTGTHCAVAARMVILLAEFDMEVNRSSPQSSLQSLFFFYFALVAKATFAFEDPKRAVPAGVSVSVGQLSCVQLTRPFIMILFSPSLTSCISTQAHFNMACAASSTVGR